MVQAAARAGRVRHRRLGARPSGRRRRGDRPRPDGAAARAAPRCRGLLPEARHPDAGRRPRNRSRTSRAASLAALESAAGARPDVITRKSRREIEKMRAGRADRRRGPRAGRVGAQARRHDRPPRLARRAPHPGGRRHPSFKGYRRRRTQGAVPGQHVHLDRRRGRPRHPGRPDDQGRLACPSTSARSSMAGTATARGRSSSATSARGAGPRRATRLAMMAGHRRRRAGRPHRRHLGRDRGRRPGGRLRHRPAVRRPRHRHRDAPGPAGPELPDRLRGVELAARDLPRDRADVHARRRRGLRRSRTAGRSSRGTAPLPPTSSTRSR